MIIDVVVSFSGREHLGQVGAGMQVPIFIVLHKDTSTGKERSISHDDEGFADFQETKYWSGLKAG